MFIKIERLPGNPNSCIFRCFRSFFTDIICSQSLRRENFTITLSLSFLRRCYASMSRGDTSLLIYLKMVSTLSSNSLFCPLSGIPTTSRHSSRILGVCPALSFNINQSFQQFENSPHWNSDISNCTFRKICNLS